MWQRWRVFLGWAVGLSTLWVLANLPENGGSLKWFLEWAGFPWTFAFWDSGRLKWFDPVALAADVVLGVALVVAVAGLCAWSRRGVSGEPAGPQKPADGPDQRVKVDDFLAAWATAGYRGVQVWTP